MWQEVFSTFAGAPRRRTPRYRGLAKVETSIGHMLREGRDRALCRIAFRQRHRLFLPLERVWVSCSAPRRVQGQSRWWWGGIAPPGCGSTEESRRQVGRWRAAAEAGACLRQPGQLVHPYLLASRG